MPHCILEYSDNIRDNLDPSSFFTELHRIIISNGPFALDQIKSRVIRHSDYFVGDGARENAFIYLQIAILSGRDKGIREKLSTLSLNLLERTFPKSKHELRCSITVEVREVDKSTHSRSMKKEV